jgi:hypothetical protein
VQPAGSAESTWYESYWWSPPLADKCGAPWDQWMFNRYHGTHREAVAMCKAAQNKQPYIWYQVREVKLRTVLKSKPNARTERQPPGCAHDGTKTI